MEAVHIKAFARTVTNNVYTLLRFIDNIDIIFMEFYQILLLTLCFSFNQLHFFYKKNTFFLSLNFLNFSRKWSWDFLKIFLTFAGINRLKRVTLYL